MVCGTWPRSALAPYPRCLRHPGGRDDVAADRRGARVAQVRRLVETLPHAASPGRRADRRGHSIVVRTRLQQQSRPPAVHRPGCRGAVRWTSARVGRCIDVAEGHRPLHRRCDCLLRLRAGRGLRGYQRAPGSLARLRRTRRRRGPVAQEGHARAGRACVAARSKLGLASGPDGSGRDHLYRCSPGLSDLPAACHLAREAGAAYTVRAKESPWHGSTRYYRGRIVALLAGLTPDQRIALDDLVGRIIAEGGKADGDPALVADLVTRLAAEGLVALHRRPDGQVDVSLPL